MLADDCMLKVRGTSVTLHSHFFAKHLVNQECLQAEIQEVLYKFCITLHKLPDLLMWR